MQSALALKRRSTLEWEWSEDYPENSIHRAAVALDLEALVDTLQNQTEHIDDLPKARIIQWTNRTDTDAVSVSYL